MTLKELRTSNGLTRKQLADLLGVAVPTICRYENGDRRLPVPVAVTIGELLHFPWHKLYEQQEPEQI